MQNAPTYEIDLGEFWQDPYPDLMQMREQGPVLFVPQLGAALMTRRDDIFKHEKMIDVFSSVQPEGLMQRLMGQNMMRKDGKAHQTERKAVFPTVSPRTVKNDWKAKFQAKTGKMLDEIHPHGQADMVKDVAMRISGEALKIITGLTQITWMEMDRVSQGMIDGCANYAGDPAIETKCNECTAAIDRYIDEMVPHYKENPDNSLLSVQLHAGLPDESIRANIKLAISGGQNEPRDVISGMVWALLTHPDQFDLVKSGEASWGDVFGEYARWISPVGMSPRRVAKEYELYGVTLEPEDKVFFMFGAANRDERVFENPESFEIKRDNSSSVPFGAGPHYCAGAAASRCLIAEVVVPSLFDRLSGLRLAGACDFGGWAFRGPLRMPIEWDA